MHMGKQCLLLIILLQSIICSSLPLSHDREGSTEDRGHVGIPHSGESVHHNCSVSDVRHVICQLTAQWVALSTGR